MTIMMSLRNNTQPRFLHDVRAYADTRFELLVRYHDDTRETINLDSIWWYREYDMSLEKKRGQPAVVNTPVLAFVIPELSEDDAKAFKWFMDDEEGVFPSLRYSRSVTWNVKPKDKNNDEII